MTTGAITLPRYFNISDKLHSPYMSERTADIANHDHVMGAIIVEVVDNKRYHFRQIQADADGGFVDLAEFYDGDTERQCMPRPSLWEIGILVRLTPLQCVP